jgi:hypothetical protein
LNNSQLIPRLPEFKNAYFPGCRQGKRTGCAALGSEAARSAGSPLADGAQDLVVQRLGEV